MGDMHETLSKLGDLAGKFANMPPLELDTYSYVKDIVTQPPEIKIDPKSTFAYQMQQQTRQILEKSDEQIRLLSQQNEQLLNNYQKLEGLYVLKEQELNNAKQEALLAKEEAEKLKREKILSYIFNFITLTIAILAWLCPRG